MPKNIKRRTRRLARLKAKCFENQETDPQNKFPSCWAYVNRFSNDWELISPPPDPSHPPLPAFDERSGQIKNIQLSFSSMH